MSSGIIKLPIDVCESLSLDYTSAVRTEQMSTNPDQRSPWSPTTVALTIEGSIAERCDDTATVTLGLIHVSFLFLKKPS
jgi:hypothetical protein